MPTTSRHGNLILTLVASLTAYSSQRDKLLEELEIERALHAKTKEEHTMALVKVSSELRDLAIKQVMEAVAQHSTDLDERERAIQEKYDKRLKEQGALPHPRPAPPNTIFLTLPLPRQKKIRRKGNESCPSSWTLSEMQRRPSTRGCTRRSL